MSLGCLVLCAGDEGSRDSLQAEGMPRQAEAKTLKRGAHQSGSQLALRLANSWAEEIKGRGVISLSERVNVFVLSMMMMVPTDHYHYIWWRWKTI